MIQKIVNPLDLKKKKKAGKMGVWWGREIHIQLEG